MVVELIKYFNELIFPSTETFIIFFSLAFTVFFLYNRSKKVTIKGEYERIFLILLISVSLYLILGIWISIILAPIYSLFLIEFNARGFIYYILHPLTVTIIFYLWFYYLKFKENKVVIFVNTLKKFNGILFLFLPSIAFIIFSIILKFSIYE